MSQLHKWKEISNHFTGENSAIILGNGASMAIHNGFSYSNLYNKAVEQGHINEQVQEIFNDLETQDFEFVLRMLGHTNYINKKLEIDNQKITRTYESVRNALIQAVSDNFPQYQEVENNLMKSAEFLKQFKIVISLNYDYLVYWSMLKYNEQSNKTWFKDCFNKDDLNPNLVFYSNWEELEKPQKDVQGSTLVFYPHGNLILATDIYGEEIKIAKTEKTNLLEIIRKKWETGEYYPLFVSEGTPHDKKRAIQSSNYLKTVYDEVLSRLEIKKKNETIKIKNLVIYGWSMSEQDEHILKAIAKGKIESIAVSVHKPTNDKCIDIKNKLQKVFKESEKELKDNQITFFDSSSPGCWINEEKENC